MVGTWSFAVGAAVEVFWKDENRWFPGTVVALGSAADTFEVAYDDGDREGGVVAALMRPSDNKADMIREAEAAAEKAVAAALEGKAWSWAKGGLPMVPAPVMTDDDREFNRDPFMYGDDSAEQEAAVKGLSKPYDGPMLDPKDWAPEKWNSEWKEQLKEQQKQQQQQEEGAVAQT